MTCKLIDPDNQNILFTRMEMSCVFVLDYFILKLIGQRKREREGGRGGKKFYATRARYPGNIGMQRSVTPNSPGYGVNCGNNFRGDFVASPPI